jgi:hypothetical protein
MESKHFTGDDDRELSAPRDWRDHGISCPSCGVPDGYECEPGCDCWYCDREPINDADLEHHWRGKAS